MKWGWTITRVLKQTATADTFVRVRTSVLPALLGGTVNQLGNTVGQLGNLVRLDSQSEGRNLDQDERNLLLGNGALFEMHVNLQANGSAPQER